MLFAIAEFLNQGAEAELINHSMEISEFLGPSAHGIVAAGVLRDESGKRVGYLAFVDRETVAEAQAWLEQTPIHRAQLADRRMVLEFQVEVGRLG